MHYPVNKDPGRDDDLRIDAASSNQAARLDDSGGRRHRHNGIKIAGRFAVSQVALAICTFALEQGKIGVQGVLQHILMAIDATGFLAFRKRRAYRSCRIKSRDPGPTGADALG